MAVWPGVGEHRDGWPQQTHSRNAKRGTKQTAHTKHRNKRACLLPAVFPLPVSVCMANREGKEGRSRPISAVVSADGTLSRRNKSLRLSGVLKIVGDGFTGSSGVLKVVGDGFTERRNGRVG